MFVSKFDEKFINLIFYFTSFNKKLKAIFLINFLISRGITAELSKANELVRHILQMISL
jgi:hypothetical protein